MSNDRLNLLRRLCAASVLAALPALPALAQDDGPDLRGLSGGVELLPGTGLMDRRDGAGTSGGNSGAIAQVSPPGQAAPSSNAVRRPAGNAPAAPQVPSSDVPAAAKPLSAIEWLDSRPSDRVIAPGIAPGAPQGSAPLSVGLPNYDPGRRAPAPEEPPVTNSAGIPQVSTRRLEEAGATTVGLLPTTVTGLPVTLWQGADSRELARQITALDVDSAPAMQELLFMLLLAEAEPPASDGDDRLLRARIAKLRALGAVDPALALITLAGPDRSKALFSDWFDLSLIAGDETDACEVMIDRPELAPDHASRIFCLARAQDWATAALILDTATALGGFGPDQERLLTRFMLDDLDDGAVPMPPPPVVTPLLFRLSEGIGEPLPTSSLPRAFAVSDLRGLSGWKAQLEAAERLAATGAISGNRLLGIYSEGRRAASGGIWDRVDAIQTLDRALNAPGDRRAVVLKALPDAWQAATEVELEVPFAQIYGERLAEFADAPGTAGNIAFRAALLAPEPAIQADTLAPRGAEGAFLLALAAGKPQDARPYNRASDAVARGFDPSTRPPARILSLLNEGRLGEAILVAMRLYGNAMEGEMKDAEAALAGFRAMGLEETARRGALQLLLLERRG